VVLLHNFLSQPNTNLGAFIVCKADPAE